MKATWTAGTGMEVRRGNMSLVLIITGLVFLLAIGSIFLYQYNFLSTAKRTNAKVVDYVVPKGKRLMEPVFEYITDDNVTRTYFHQEGTNPPMYHIGQEVELFYDPADPQDVSLGYRVVPMSILGGIGALLLVIGIALKDTAGYDVKRVKRRKDPARYVVFIFFGVAVILYGITFYIYKARREFAKTAVLTEGVVVDLIQSGRRGGGFAPVIEYPDNQGKYHVYYHNVYTTPSAYELSEKVEILVDPEDPKQVEINGESIVFWILSGIGTLFLLFAGGLFLAFRKEF